MKSKNTVLFFQIKTLVDKLEIVQSELPQQCHVVLPNVPEMKVDEEPEK